MNDKIDELFSPERLRKNWFPVEKPNDRPVAQKNVHSAMELFEYIKRLLKKRFSGNQVIALNSLLKELEMLLLQMFPEPEKDNDHKEDLTNLSISCNEVLNRIEDLTEAFEGLGHAKK